MLVVACVLCHDRAQAGHTMAAELIGICCVIRRASDHPSCTHDPTSAAVALHNWAAEQTVMSVGGLIVPVGGLAVRMPRLDDTMDSNAFNALVCVACGYQHIPNPSRWGSVNWLMDTTSATTKSTNNIITQTSHVTMVLC